MKPRGPLMIAHRQARSRVKSIVELVLWLAAFYPVHIRKEDREFFPHTERYVTPAELKVMLERFWEFDRNMIHEKYRVVYEEIRA